MPPVIVKKSVSSSIYATTDLATILQRERDFAPAEIWYVVDKRQSLHFTQVFRCAKKAGLVPPSARLEHLGFGTMNGSDGKPYKTRDQRGGARNSPPAGARRRQIRGSGESPDQGLRFRPG